MGCAWIVWLGGKSRIVMIMSRGVGARETAGFGMGRPPSILVRWAREGEELVVVWTGDWFSCLFYLVGWSGTGEEVDIVCQGTSYSIHSEITLMEILIHEVDK